jgi:hypothetical protein
MPGSVPGSGSGSWFDEKWTSWVGFGFSSKQIQDIQVPGRFLVNLVLFVPYVIPPPLPPVSLTETDTP